MEQKRTFKVTVHHQKYQEKPKRKDASEIRKTEKNSIEEVSIYQLAHIIGLGRTVLLGEHDLVHHLHTSKLSLKEQQVFGVDVDHGNFSLKELKQRLAELPIQYSMIYKTFSYDETYNRRWRILFLSSKKYYQAEDVQYISRYLTYALAKDFQNNLTWVEEIDTQSTDAGRMFFGGTLIEGEIHENFVDFDFVFDEALIQETNAFFNDISQIKNNPNERFTLSTGDVYEGNLIEHLEHQKKEKYILKEQDRKDKELQTFFLANTIKERLTQLDLSEIKHEFNYNERFDLINKIPLTYLLGVNYRQNFNCVLPHHVDRTPSANILYNADGYERYHCFGCMEKGHVLKTSNLLNMIFNKAYDEQKNVFETIQEVYALIGVDFKSDYQQIGQRVLENNLQLIKDLKNIEQGLDQRLSARNLKHFYLEFLELALQSLTFQPILIEQDKHSCSVFLSNRYLQRQLSAKGLTGTGCIASINKKINFLVTIGLIDKIDYNDLEDHIKEGYRKRLEKLQANKDPKFQRYVEALKQPDYYRIHELTPEALKSAFESIEHRRLHAGRSAGQTAKQAKALYGEERAREIYRQPTTNLNYNKKELRFLKEARKVLDQKLQTTSDDYQGYITEKELLSSIDKKNNHFNKKEKQRYSLVLLPVLMEEYGLIKRPINKLIRAYYNVPEKVTKMSHVMFSKEAWNEIQAEQNETAS